MLNTIMNHKNISTEAISGWYVGFSLMRDPKQTCRYLNSYSILKFDI